MKELKDIILELQEGSLREDSSIEFKADLPHDNAFVASIIIDMANNHGGYIILGVEKKTNGIELVGVRDVLVVVNTLDNILNNLTRGVAGNLVVRTINNREIVILQVEKSKSVACFHRKYASLKKSFFLVILGDVDNSHFDKMKERLVCLGVTHRLLENTFLLFIDESNSDSWTVQKVRNIVAGDDLGYCLVIRINKGFSSAWNLTKDDSGYFLDVLEKLQDGKTE